MVNTAPLLFLINIVLEGPEPSEPGYIMGCQKTYQRHCTWIVYVLGPTS